MQHALALEQQPIESPSPLPVGWRLAMVARCGIAANPADPLPVRGRGESWEGTQKSKVVVHDHSLPTQGLPDRSACHRPLSPHKIPRQQISLCVTFFGSGTIFSVVIAGEQLASRLMHDNVPDPAPLWAPSAKKLPPLRHGLHLKRKNRNC